MFSFTGDPPRRQYTDPELDALAPGGKPGRARGLRYGPAAPSSAPLTSSVQFPPPELAAYPSASMVYGDGSATIANGASAAVGAIRLSEANVGVINSLIIYGVNIVLGLVASWVLRVNEAGVAGGRRVLPPQTAAAASIAWGPSEVLWRIPQGALVDIFITVTAGGPAELGASFSGWEYPVPIGDRFSAVWE